MSHRAFVFAEHQIEPALTAWFGSQRLSLDDERLFQSRLMAFLTSPEAAVLRMPQYDPPPDLPPPAAAALAKAA